MSVSLFSFLLVLIIVRILYQSNTRKKYIDLFIFAFAIDLFFLRGYFIGFGNTYVGFKFIADCIILPISSIGLIFSCKNKYNNKLMLLGFVLLFEVFVGIIYAMIFPYDNLIGAYGENFSWDAYIVGKDFKSVAEFNFMTTAMMYIKLICYVFNVYIMKLYFRRIDYVYIFNKLILYSKLIVAYSIIEFVFKNFFSATDVMYSFTDIILGANDDGHYYERGMLVPIHGFTREPAHFALSMFLITTILLIKWKICKKCEEKFVNKRFLQICILVLLLCGSFSATWYLGIIVMMFFLLKNNVFTLSSKYMKKFLISFFIIMCFIATIVNQLMDIFPFLSQRIENVFFIIDVFQGGYFNSDALSQMDSSLARFVSIRDTFIDFCNRPILGQGLGMQSSHGGLVNLFSDFGIIGCLTWAVFVNVEINDNIKHDYCFFVVFFFIASIPTGNANYAFEVVYICIYMMTRYYLPKTMK